MVELDQEVIELSKRYFPQVSDGAFDDRRVNLVIGDGVEYVTQVDAQFDVVIIDFDGSGRTRRTTLHTRILRAVPDPASTEWHDRAPSRCTFLQSGATESRVQPACRFVRRCPTVPRTCSNLCGGNAGSGRRRKKPGSASARSQNTAKAVSDTAVTHQLLYAGNSQSCFHIDPGVQPRSFAATDQDGADAAAQPN